MIKTIQFNGDTYPEFQAHGFASKFIFPFADQILFGRGVDVGCNREEWMLPILEHTTESILPKRYVMPVDPALSEGEFHAMNFPRGCNNLDFVFSSHCLEHVPNWTEALDYWASRLKSGGGIMFLYLPDFSQKYWRPFNNRKHIHSFTPEIVASYFNDQPKKWRNVFVSGVDLNNSFTIIAEKVL